MMYERFGGDPEPAYIEAALIWSQLASYYSMYAYINPRIENPSYSLPPYKGGRSETEARPAIGLSGDQLANF